MVCLKHFFKNGFHVVFRKRNEKCNETKSNQEQSNAVKIDQQCRQSKSPFQAFLGTTYYSDTKFFFVDQPWWLTFCQGIFARGH